MLLETVPAVHWSTLRGFEGNFRLLPAVRTSCLVHCSGTTKILISTTHPPSTPPNGYAITEGILLIELRKNARVGSEPTVDITTYP